MNLAQLNKRDRLVLAALGDMPFADADEIAVFAGLQGKPAQESLDRCLGNGLVGFVGYRRSDVVYSRRWYLTGQGIGVLSGLEGATLAKVLIEKPVSVEWQRSLLRRLDSVDLLYRLLAAVAKLDGGTPEWVWHREGAFDAAMRLRNGKAFALMRLGTTLSWQATKSRLGALYTKQEKREAPPALVIVPSEIDALRISEYLAKRAIDLYLVSAEAFDRMQIGEALWQKAGDRAASAALEQVLEKAYARGRMPTAQMYRNETLPGDDIHERINEAYLAASELKAQEKRMLRLLYDWPLIKNEQLAAMLGISSGRLNRPRAALVGQGLTHVVQIGKSL